MQPLSLLRNRQSSHANQVGPTELYFDLVFVFAMTQISHFLLEHLSFHGTFQSAILFFALWWVWIYTAWVTNWLNPEKVPVRLCMLSLMALGVVLALSLSNAFGYLGLVFAGTYVTMQVGRTVFLLWAFKHGDRAMVKNFKRTLLWLILSGFFWIAGAVVSGNWRVNLWLIALLIEVISPIIYFWVPGMGRSRISDWTVSSSHFAERCGLFVIIALGESFLLVGTTFTKQDWQIDAALGMALTLVGNMVLWWLYFDSGAQRAHEQLVKSSEPGQQARSAYTYLHLPIIAGIIVFAVGCEVAVVHPHEVSVSSQLLILGSAFTYLVGTMMFKWRMNTRKLPPFSHLIGFALLALLAAYATVSKPEALPLLAATLSILAVVAVWESLAIRRQPA